MANRPSPVTNKQSGNSFDVTCVIGTVVYDDLSSEAANAVAFRLIGEHNAPGTYSFPMANGGTIRVIVEHWRDIAATNDEYPSMA
jgi:hypothetical protein